jgi:hypothetical protein
LSASYQKIETYNILGSRMNDIQRHPVLHRPPVGTGYTEFA